MSKFNLLLLLVLSTSLSFADIYKWVDDSGRVHYSDKADSSFTSKKIEIKINSYDSVSYKSLSPKNSSLFKGNKVIMYSTSWCGYCKKARRYFKSNNILFIEYDIEKNARAKREYDALGAKGVPVILAKNKRMNGFSAAGFERIYK